MVKIVVVRCGEKRAGDMRADTGICFDTCVEGCNPGDLTFDPNSIPYPSIAILKYEFIYKDILHPRSKQT